MTLMDMYSEMGDRIALQYGGSEAHSKMGQSGSSLKGSGELLTSIKRYYSNSFTDRVKQDAINLFLGHFIPSQSRVSLWELDSDYHLHNKTLRPPLAYADELLCNLKGNYFIQERQNQFFDMNEDDTIVIGKSNVRHQYVVAPFVDTVTAEEAINRKELRKLIHREKSQRIEEAQQEWWKATHEYDAQKDWLCIEMNDDEEGGSKWTSLIVYIDLKIDQF